MSPALLVRTLAFGAVLCLCFAVRAEATPLVLDDDRSVSVAAVRSCGASSCTFRSSASATHDGSSPSFFAGRQALDGYVFQTSSISDGGIFGIGLTRSAVAIDIVNVNAQSVLSITFELLEDTPYALFGSLDLGVGTDARNPAGSASVTLSDAGGALHAFSLTSAGVTDSEGFSESGVLAAGVYTLFARAAQGPSSDGLTSRFEVDLALPEPSAWLLLAGLLLLPRRLRRARSEARAA
jgi:hypothetical protein